MCIRDFVLSDLSSLRQMVHDTIDASYSGVYPERAVEFFKTFHSEERIRERSQKGEILIIERNNVIMATGAIVGNEVLGVFVRPLEQGRGYGKAIMNELERRAKAEGLTQITLAVSLPSRKFYEALGYEIVRDNSVDVGEGQHLDYWEARKSVAPVAVR
jgi:GNAT superfamily N-acetyltransferase